jgi:hypothetical protein
MTKPSKVIPVLFLTAVIAIICGMGLLVLGCAGQDQSGIKAEIDSFRTELAMVSEKVNTTQGPAIINFASEGGGLWGYIIAVGLVMLCWRQYRSKKYVEKHAGCLAQAIEEFNTSGEIKTAVAKGVSRDTQFGKLVAKANQKTNQKANQKRTRP